MSWNWSGIFVRGCQRLKRHAKWFFEFCSGLYTSSLGILRQRCRTRTFGCYRRFFRNYIQLCVARTGVKNRMNYIWRSKLRWFPAGCATMSAPWKKCRLMCAKWRPCRWCGGRVRRDFCVGFCFHATTWRRRRYWAQSRPRWKRTSWALRHWYHRGE